MIEAGSSQSGSRSKFAKTKCHTGTECLDPRLEDPEGWQCDCYERWMEWCANNLPAGSYTAAECARGHMCEHADVCCSWKEYASCDESEPASLLSRRASVEGKNNNFDGRHFESTNNFKMC